MKKTFRFLALSFALICGTLVSSAAPLDGSYVGQKVSGGVVTYQVDMTLGPVKDLTTTYNGESVKIKAYPVKIAGLDYDGLHAENLTKLNISTSFIQKDGPELNAYYVAEIIDTQGNDASLPNYKKAFYAMTDLVELTFAADANAVKEEDFTFSVGEYAFYGCDHLKKLVLPDNVDKIGKYAFQNAAITEFTIPAQCKTIGENAFYNTQGLLTVKVSDNKNAKMTTLGAQVFANSRVEKLDLTNATALTTIDNNAFIYDLSIVNNTLKEIDLPVATPAVFANLGTSCANLTGLTTLKNLEQTAVVDIVNGAFENCESLTELYFPIEATIADGGTSVVSAFKGCESLATLRFIDGWHGTVGSNVYLSKGLTPAQQKAELGYLTTIIFEGQMDGIIDSYAFGNADAALACSGLTSVTVKKELTNKEEGAEFGLGSFMNCAALATLTLNGVLGQDNCSSDMYFREDAFKGTAITSVNFGKIDMQQKTSTCTWAGFYIMEGAFAADGLTTVTFGDISFAGVKTNRVIISKNAFVSDKLKKAIFGKVTAADENGDFEIGSDATPAFAAKTVANGVLEEVEFGDMTTGHFTIYENAFKSEALKSVKIGNVTTAKDKNGELFIGKQAFGFLYTAPAENKAQEKTVTIGDIDENGTGTLIVTIGDLAFNGDKLKTVTIGKLGANSTTIGTTSATDFTSAPFGGNSVAKTVTITKGITGDAVSIQPYAFYGDNLTTVTIGEISGKNVAIKDYAFAGKTLATVTIGDISSETSASLGTYSFANLNQDTDDFAAMEEKVTIGKFATANLTINPYAFQGPKKDGSKFTVTIGDVEKAATVSANAFVAPNKGESSYTLGKIDATIGTNVSFVGSKDAEGVNSTIVTIGDYNAPFNDKTFNKVNTVNIASWNAASNLSRFQGAINVNVKGDVTKNMGGAYMNSVKNITFGGNIKGAVIGGASSFGTGVRSIKFTAADPEVDAGVLAASAFADASDAAADDEQIVVVYKTQTAIKSNNIFNKTTFGTDDAYKNVILYTDDWSKANTFENVEILADRVWRLTLSASSVVPGDAIKANCVAQTDGSRAYGKLFVPAGTGMKYYVDAEVADGKTGVNLFSATIDGADIRMKQVDIVDGKYWIDATEKNQVFVVRIEKTRESLTVEAKEATQEVIDAQPTLTDDDWFDASLAKKNALRYTPSAIANQELQNNAEFKKKGIYVMANPKNNGLAFALLDQYNTKRNLAKGSLYVLSKTAIYARLNVVWEDEMDNDATAIKNVETVSEDNDAIYNLNGVRVNGNQKGIFIKNGKKIVVK
jgi:hypothetical protein